MTSNNYLEICKYLRYLILTSSTNAGSGHPTSSLSAVELMVALTAGGFFKFDVKNPHNQNNDVLIFSKGHATPLFYSLWALCKGIDVKELDTYRKFGSRLEGHPTHKFPFTAVSTGSLGQGLSLAAGFAYNAKNYDFTKSHTYVLLGDGELEEGSNFEAMDFASYNNLDNLTVFVDVNKYEQVGQTLNGYDLSKYVKKFLAFGFETIEIENGHDINQIIRALNDRQGIKNKPVAIIAKTIKGKGISFLEDSSKWHGKVLKSEELSKAVIEICQIDPSIRINLSTPTNNHFLPENGALNETYRLSIDPSVGGRADSTIDKSLYLDKQISTREAFGNGLARLSKTYKNLVGVDAGVSNSTYSSKLKDANGNFIEMFIAEQNMVSVATSLSLKNKIVFASTFAAFFTRAHDQIRMSRLNDANIKFCGTHVGVSIGEDGSSQMALEDIAMFRSILTCIVMYPCDGISTEKIMNLLAEHKGISYLRLSRENTDSIYGRHINRDDDKKDAKETEFKIGGSHCLKSSKSDIFTIVGAGVTVHQSLLAYDLLKKDGINVRIVDLYSIKPLDIDNIIDHLSETKNLLVVEDHYAEGGIYEAVLSAINEYKIKNPGHIINKSGHNIYSLCVKKVPCSGKPDELRNYENISSESIIKTIKKVINTYPNLASTTKLFLDSANIADSKQVLDIFGQLDGQTTNPSLVAKSLNVEPESAKRTSKSIEQKLSEGDLLSKYKEIILEIRKISPNGDISVEVPADKNTTSAEMIKYAKMFNEWSHDLFIKLPITSEGLKAGEILCKDGINLNFTLCFSEEQAAAVYSATKNHNGSKIYISPFVGRLDDTNVRGLDLVKNIVSLYKNSDHHVKVLMASVRSLYHMLYGIRVLKVDAITAPLENLVEYHKYLEEKASVYNTEASLDFEDQDLDHLNKLKHMPNIKLNLNKNWNEYNISHPLTDKGLQKFAEDWNNLLIK